MREALPIKRTPAVTFVPHLQGWESDPVTACLPGLPPFGSTKHAHTNSHLPSCLEGFMPWSTLYTNLKHKAQQLENELVSLNQGKQSLRLLGLKTYAQGP